MTSYEARQSVAELRDRVSAVDGFYSALKTRRDDLDKELSNLKAEIDLLTKTSAVLKHILDLMVKDDVAKMSGLITYGLKTIFYDQDLSFIPVITKKNDRINIELVTRNGTIEGSFGSFGGSVAVIESFLLRILCMLKLKLARVMVLDETFASVGEVYIPNTCQLIAELSKKLGLDILLVTHQKEFQNHADHVYKVRESSEGLVMEKTK
jgi:hypothetical protein